MKIPNVNVSVEMCELHNCLRDVMKLCRWFGFFPVVGLDGAVTTNLRFSYSYKSAYSIYNIATVFGQVVLAGCYMYSFFIDKLSLNSTFCSLLDAMNRNANKMTKKASIFSYEGVILKPLLQQATVALFGIIKSIGALRFVYVQSEQDPNISLFSKETFMLFYLNSVFSAIFLWHLAKHWRHLIQKTKEIEKSITVFKISKKVPLKLKAVAYSMLFSALVEHLLSLVQGWDIVTTCSNHYEIYDLLLKYYILRIPPALLLLCPVTVLSAIFYQIVNFQATFLWTFLDVMIICISMYLTEYFKELNRIVTKYKQKTIAAAMWEKIRRTHYSLVTLVNIINKRLSHCVLLAFFTDLFYICQQLYKILSQTELHVSRTCNSLEIDGTLRGPIQYVYYSYSFLFLVARVSILSVMAANVNTVAQRSRLTLAEVPASTYNSGIQRFLRQINNTDIAISGWSFYVTRRMILKVAATIITYELVMLQLQQLEK